MKQQGYLRVCKESRNWFETDFPNWLKEPAKKNILRKIAPPSTEVTSSKVWKPDVYRGHFNVMNNGAISNCPMNVLWKSPCYVDGNGISVPKVGDSP